MRKRQSKARLESAATDMSELGKMQNRLKDLIAAILMLILILLISFTLIIYILFMAVMILVCESSLFLKITLILVLLVFLLFVSKTTFEALSILSREWRRIRDYMKVVQTLKHQIDVDGFEKEDYKK